MPPDPSAPISYFRWMLESIGPVYLIMILGSALFTFILSLVVLFRARGVNAAAAWVFLAPLPLLIGIYGAFHGFLGVLSVVSRTDQEIKLREFLPVFEVLFRPWIAMLVSAPTYLVILIGSLYRALQTEETAIVNGLEKPPVR